ncbi:hypothetical protein CAEBREN_19924 [Caenorhabditis brenneri]|uniref:Uncharacterized protein n=1 Tax=Caenorhabditis brenneri TaxID=135651 RepID=G0MUH4_CAEBE|nr:hypothetical protein CAEBREN_19924 [Caenorhabditis brenneri]
MRKITLVTVVSMIVLGALLTDGSDVDEINEKRRAFAVEHKIANMYKLEHDKNLQALLDKQKVEEVCDILYEKWYQYRHEFETTNSTRWFMVPSDGITEILESEVFTYLFGGREVGSPGRPALKIEFSAESLNKEGAPFSQNFTRNSWIKP